MIRLEAIFFLIKNGEKYLSSFQIYFYDSSFPISHYHLTSRYECAIKETNQINFETTWFISLLTKTFYFYKRSLLKECIPSDKKQALSYLFYADFEKWTQTIQRCDSGVPLSKGCTAQKQSFPLSRNLWLKILFLCGVTKYNIISILMALNKKVR